MAEEQAATAPAVKPWLSKETVDRLLVAGVVIYALVLAVLTADQIFELGIFKPELDRLLDNDIDQAVALLKQQPVTAENMDKAKTFADEIVSFHEFSVPRLLRALKSSDPVRRDVARQCLGQIGQRFFNLSPDAAQRMGNDVAQWEQWWAAVRDELDRLARQAGTAADAEQ